MLAGIRDILIISTPEDTSHFEAFLGDGSSLRIYLFYAVQPSPDGLVQAFLIGEEFVGDEPCALVLGDNIFYGGWFRKNLQEALKNANEGNSTIFGYYVSDSECFEIVEFDKNKNVISVEEKLENPNSNYCITRLYFYDKRVVEMAKKVKPSVCGELEIIDLNRMYLEENNLKVQILG